MNTLIVPLVGLAVVFVGLVVLIAIVKLMGVICGFVQDGVPKLQALSPHRALKPKKLQPTAMHRSLPENRAANLSQLSPQQLLKPSARMPQGFVSNPSKKSVEPHRFLRSIMFGANKTGCIALMHYILADIRKGH